MRLKTKKSSKKTKIVLITVSVIVLIGVLFTSLAYTQSLWPFQKTTVHPTSSDERDPNIPDPTFSSDKNDDINPAPLPEDTKTDNQKSPVSVALVFAGIGTDPNMVEVRAFVSGIIEGNGTCTAALSKETLSVTETSPAFIDATTTQCEPILINRSRLSSGEWKVTVHYESPKSEGNSQENVINI